MTSSPTASSDGRYSQGVVTTMHAASVVTSEASHGSGAPTAWASRAYSTKASAATAMATTSSAFQGRNQTSANAAAASASPLSTRAM